ncbi:MAG: plastocyanin/azurin family copper-binding protein [Gemmatimonadetes bacterium]|nr:plastocyanin/azurin family copper-binding protein [Gemmatimonadota bacterium]
MARTPFIAVICAAASVVPLAPVRASFPQSPAQRSAAPDTVITVRTTGNNLAFEPDRLTVKAGATIRIRYINESTLGHNLVIVKTDDDIDPLGAAAYDAASTGYVPMQHRDRMIAWTALASPGQTVEVDFTAPPAGTYPFVCLVDGHFNVMVGTLTSRP